MTPIVTNLKQAVEVIKELESDRDRALAQVDKLNRTAQAVLKVFQRKSLCP